ncbi:MAG TPA: hypothetical protein VGF53_08180 [Pseudolabrys sp.]|jgi:hypothetical protein
MRRMQRIVLLAGLVALAPVLAGCESFDFDNLDFFHLNEKKKLPGERKELFPQGVPGVSQGIPPEYLKGSQPPADTALAPDAAAGAATPGATPAPPAKTAAVEPAAEPKPKRKPKPKSASQSPTRITVQPAAQRQDNGQQQMAPWPDTPPPASAPSTSTSPWPSAPAAASPR